jgi:hypothetical protein
VSEPDASGLRFASVRVEGQLQHTEKPFAAWATLGLAGTDVELTSVDVRGAEEDLARIAAGRRA